jgi:hypothetical protein
MARARGFANRGGPPAGAPYLENNRVPDNPHNYAFPQYQVFTGMLAKKVLAPLRR